MKNEKDKTQASKRASSAIVDLIRAANELVAADRDFHDIKSRKPRKPAALSKGGLSDE